MAWILLLGMAAASAQPAKAGVEGTVPWLDLVRESELVVVARVESVHRPGGRVERSVLQVEESWIGRPPARIALRLHAPRSALREAGIDRVPMRATGASWQDHETPSAVQPGARVLAFLASSGSERFAPVRGAEGILSLSEASEASDRRLVSLLFGAGEDLDLAAALPVLRRGDEEPSAALLAAALAELERRVGPADRSLLAGPVCQPGAYWPAVEQGAVRWAGRMQVSQQELCPSRRLVSAAER